MSNQDSRLERRDFLKISAAAGLAAVGSTAPIAQAQQSAASGGELTIRRVVTGHDENGRSLVAIDEPARTGSAGREGLDRSLIWSTDSFPVDNTDTQDGGERVVATTDEGGTVFRVVRYAPGVAPRNHRTDSIDYAVVISGAIDMEMDEGTVQLRQGDVLVQRGTIHNWINRGTEPCVIAFILISADPVTIAGTTLDAVG